MPTSVEMDLCRELLLAIEPHVRRPIRIIPVLAVGLTPNLRIDPRAIRQRYGHFP